MATIGSIAAVAKVGRFKLSGLIASLMWLFVYWLYLDQRQRRLLILFQRLRAYVTGNGSSQFTTNELDSRFRQSPEARWVVENAAGRLDKGQPCSKTELPPTQFLGGNERGQRVATGSSSIVRMQCLQPLNHHNRQSFPSVSNRKGRKTLEAASRWRVIASSNR